MLDQISKYLISNLMSPSQSIPIIKNLFHITYIKNTGAAFGILSNYQMFLIALSIIFIVIILFYFFHMPAHDLLTRSAIAVIIGGSFGNLVDRLFRGYVIDFIDVRFFSIFNIADIMINVGIFLLILKVIFYKNAPNPA